MGGRLQFIKKHSLQLFLAATTFMSSVDACFSAELGPMPVFARLNTPVAVVPPKSSSSLSMTADDFRTREYRASYGLEQIGAAQAYARGFTGNGILVAVIDSGLDSDHPEFANRISRGSRSFESGKEGTEDFSDRDPDAAGHGTHVAGTIGAARDGIGIHGVAFDATIQALRAIGEGADTNAPNAAMDAATTQGARIINGSYGPRYPTTELANGEPNPEYFELQSHVFGPQVTDAYQAIKRAANRGALLVFAAGNDRIEQPLISHNPSGAALFPYIKPENANSGVYQLTDSDLNAVDQSQVDFSDISGSIISVVSVDSHNKIGSFSNWCGVTAAWCIAAPGDEIISTVPQQTGLGPYKGYRNMSGTSMATPHVSGAAAVLAQAFPFLTAPQLAQTLFTTATPIGEREIYGWGLLNLGRAIDGPSAFTSTWDVDTQGFIGRFANDISGSGNLVKRGSGTLELTGTNTFTGSTTVAGGTLAINGSVASPVNVSYAGTLRGTGYLGDSLTSDGVVRPGNSPGTLTVAGPVTLTSDSLLALDVDGTGTGNGRGNYSRLMTDGSLRAGGVIVPVLRGISGEARNDYTPVLGQRFGVVSAANGLSGSFSSLAQPSDGLARLTRFDALYRANGLDLVVTPLRYAQLAALGIAQSGNAQVIGAAVDSVRPEAGTRADTPRAVLFDNLYAASPGTLGSRLETLSGQTYGDALLADLAGRRLLADTFDRHLTVGSSGARLKAVESVRGSGGLVTLRQGAKVDRTPLALGEGRLWADGLYGFGTRARDHAATGAHFNVGGLVVGLDRQVGENTLIGAALSYLRKSGSSASGELGRFDTNNVGGTFYGAARFGQFELRGSTSLGYSGARIDRVTSLGTNSRHVSTTPHGLDAGANVFAGYDLKPNLPLAIIPEVGFSYDYLSRSRIREASAPAVNGIGTRDLTAARSLVGGRLASLTLDAVSGLRVETRAYWTHELGDTAARIRSDLFGFGFTTRTSQINRDGALIGLTAIGEVAPDTQLSISYLGEIRPGANAHGFTAGLTATW